MNFGITCVSELMYRGWWVSIAWFTGWCRESNSRSNASSRLIDHRSGRRHRDVGWCLLVGTVVLRGCLLSLREGLGRWSRCQIDLEEGGSGSGWSCLGGWPLSCMEGPRQVVADFGPSTSELMLGSLFFYLSPLVRCQSGVFILLYEVDYTQV